LVTIVAVPPTAWKAYFELNTRVEMTTARKKTGKAAKTGMLFAPTWQMNERYGSKPSREMAYVTRWADMKQLVAVQVLLMNKRMRIVAAPLGPMICIRNSANLFGYLDLMMASKSWMDTKINARGSMEIKYAKVIETHIALGTVLLAFLVSSET
jgi:hypothetical protein